MKRHVFGILGLSAVLLAMGVAQRQETGAKTVVTLTAVVEQVGPGTVNWTQGYLEANGEAAYPQGRSGAQARLMARRGAIIDAQRNLLEVMEGVRISAESVMKDLELVSDEVRTRVEGVIKGAVIVREQDKGDAYQVTLRLPLGGDLAALVRTLQAEPEKVDPRLSREEVGRFSPPQLPPVPQAKPTPGKETLAPLPLPRVEAGPYTGLLIDCRGLGVKPSMSPKIRRADGTEVWGTLSVSSEYVNAYGIVAYLRDPKDLTHPDIVARIGQRPLVVRAIGAVGKFHTDPLLSDEDVRRVLEENARYYFLDQMRVAFLVDPS